MSFRAVTISLLAMGALANPTWAASFHAGPSGEHSIPKPRCTPPDVAVWGRISTRGAPGWHCMLPPAPKCGKHANPIWHPATSTWTCEACPPGETAYSTPASGGGRFGHCKKPPPGHRQWGPVHFAPHIDSRTH